MLLERGAGFIAAVTGLLGWRFLASCMREREEGSAGSAGLHSYLQGWVTEVCLSLDTPLRRRSVGALSA